VPLNPDAHSTSRFDKSVHHNLAALMVDHKNKWESVGLMDGYYVVGIIGIPYPKSWGDHTFLRFVTTCDNGVFNEGGGIYAPLNIFPSLFVNMKLL